jgi:ribosomal protein S20
MRYEYEMRRIGTTIRLVALTCALSLGLSGCRHKAVVPPLPAISQPVDLETPPAPDKPEMVEAPPAKLPPPPTAAAASKPRRERRKTTKTAATPATTNPPVQVASAETPSPEETAIGALSSGGDSSPRAQQEAADLIASIEKRLNALPAQKAEAEKTQISKIKNFQRQAQDALTSGDAEGAKTLATKAKLLLDDLEK